MASSMTNFSKHISVTTIVITFIALVSIIYTQFWQQTSQRCRSAPSHSSHEQLSLPTSTEQARTLVPKELFSSDPETSVLERGPNAAYHGPRTSNADGASRGGRSDGAANSTAHIPWEERLPTRNGGFLMVQEEGSGPAIQYGVSMFHQLHCVMMLRDRLIGGGGHKMHHHARDSNAGNQSEDQPGTEEDHLVHCLDYIAQAILCAADDTVEPADIWVNAEGKKVRILNGIGQLHQCRNPEAVWQAVTDSESGPVKPWDFKNGDTLSSLRLIP